MPCMFPGQQSGGKFRGIWPEGSTAMGKLRGIWPEGSQAYTWGGGSAPGGSAPRAWSRGGLLPGAWSQEGLCGDPPPGWLLLRTVHILLECILVAHVCGLVCKDTRMPFFVKLLQGIIVSSYFKNPMFTTSIACSRKINLG